MMYCGIRARLLFAVLTPAAAILVVMLLLLANTRLARFGDGLEAQAQLIAREWAPAIERALIREDRNTLQHIAQAVIQSKRVDRLRVRGQQGQILIDVSELQAPSRLAAFVSQLLHMLPADSPLQRPIAVLRLHPTIYAATSLRQVTAGTLGTLEVEMSVSDAVYEHLPALLLPGLLALAALFCAGLLALITANTILTPVRKLVRYVQQLEHGHLESGALTGARGELGQLETATEAMTKALRQRQYQLQEQVHRTTSELRQTLRALEVQNVELDVARKRALEASQIKSQFLANVSHEIRTPINGIVGFAELLYHSPLDAEQREHLDTIKTSCANLLTIINDILDFSKIEAGKLEIDSVAFDLRDSVEEVLTLLAPTAYGKGLELVQLIDADVPANLTGDPSRIRQILTNLVHNAIKFTHRGHIVVRVLLEEESEADARLRITISDTGIGLSEEDQVKLFSAFSQAGESPARHVGGTGLGLIISKKLVEQMGGAIGLESEPQQGSTFWFTLRLQKQRNAQPAAAIGQNLLAGRHVLLLDDEPLSRLATQNLLAPWGVNLIAAENDAAFLARLDREGPWDVAILGVTGNALHRDRPEALVNRCVEAAVPLMVLASTVDRAQLHRFHKSGACAALAKATRRQIIFRELCQLIAAPNLPSLPSAHHDETVIARGTTTPPIFPARVLVVDDNKINRRLVRSIATRHGASADEACDGFEAVMHCRNRNYDAIFMDIHMPGLGGEEAAQHIRQLCPRERMPKIIALTANAMPGERERLLAGGLDECLIKPITEEQVTRFLGPRQAACASTDPIVTASRCSLTSPVDLPEVELAQMLRMELPQHRERIRQAYRSGDMARLREHVHRLHGGASICRLTPLKQACRDLEEVLIKDKRHALIASMKRLLTEIAKQLDDSRGRPPTLSV